MIRPFRKFHFIIWHLIAVVLPLVFILAITVRPDIAERVPRTGTTFLMEIKNATDTTLTLLITVARPLEVPSCLVYARLQEEEILLGKLDRQGRYSYEIPATSQSVAIRLYDPIKKKEIHSFNLRY